MSLTFSSILPDQYQAAVEAAEIGVWDVDVSCSSVMLSDICRWLLGIQVATPLTLENLYEQLHPADVTGFKKGFDKALDPVLRKPIDLEFRIVNQATGEVLRWLRAKGKTSFDDAGVPVRLNGIMTDVSYRKQVEQELQQSVNEFRLLADSLPQVVWTARPDGYVDYWNKRWYQLTGNMGEGDESWKPLVHPDDAPKVVELWQHSLQTGDSYKIEARLYDQQKGEYRWYLGMAFPVRDKNGNIIKWFGTNTDIHEQKVAANLLELKVQERTGQLERINRELEQFAYVASHDLQEPLRKIRTFISMMEERFSTLSQEQFAGYMDRIKTSAQRMSTLINDLLNLSRTTQADEQWLPVDLNEVVQQVTEDLELMISQKEAMIKCDTLPLVNGIPLQLRQLFYNLLQNALKFSRPGVAPIIQVRCQLLKREDIVVYTALDPQKYYARITVQDNGIGFEPEHTDRVFGMFPRLQGKNLYEGTGIGLALCKKVVENHHGMISATSVTGQGTTMTILLPLDESK